MITAKDNEIEELKRQLEETSPPSGSVESVSHLPPGGGASHTEEPARTVVPRTRRGKAPPVDSFTGEDLEVWLDDWLPSLERAKLWNGWTEDELMLQLAGHLRGRAHQEWSLLGAEAKTSYDTAVKALRLRLDPGSCTLAAQEFCHTTQGDAEKVADFIRWLEHTFNVAYGREGMSMETRIHCSMASSKMLLSMILCKYLQSLVLKRIKSCVVQHMRRSNLQS